MGTLGLSCRKKVWFTILAFYETYVLVETGFGKCRLSHKCARRSVLHKLTLVAFGNGFLFFLRLR
jgi:hypothetical protein